MARNITGRLFGGNSRLRTQAKNNLGTIMTDQMGRERKFRDDALDLYDAYYESRQYDDLPQWDAGPVQTGEYIPVRKRQPRVIYNVAKVLIDTVSAKICGRDLFPQFKIEDDPDDTDFLRTVQKVSNFRANLIDTIKHTLLSGSCFQRFYLVDGVLKMEWYNSKFCYPVFNPAGELAAIQVKYLFEDQNDRDNTGKPKVKWYGLELSETTDILFDTPEYQPNVEPRFTPVETVEHNLGWVQGEWFRTAKDKFKPDGPSLIGDILDFIDELNYSVGQSTTAVSYNQDPQLTVNGIDAEELDTLIRSSTKAWNLGRDGKAAFLESNMKGVEIAIEHRKEKRQMMLDVVRVVLHDPEKMAAQAQSGRALEILHAPLVALVDELRTILEPSLKNLLIKVGLSLLEFNARGEETALEAPQGYVPSSLDITVVWPPVFPATLEDIAQKVTAAVAATTAMILSRESAMRWIAKDFGVEDIDAELEKIESEPILNPFGGGFSPQGGGSGGDNGQ